MDTPNFQPGISSANFTPDLLIAGDHPLRFVEVTIISGQNRVRGDLLGKITTGGKCNLSLAAASDGSQTPYAILVEDVNATAGDKKGMAYIAGDFNANQVTFGTGHTAASVRDALAAKSIYLHVPVSAA